MSGHKFLERILVAHSSIKFLSFGKFDNFYFSNFGQRGQKAQHLCFGPKKYNVYMYALI